MPAMIPDAQLLAAAGSIDWLALLSRIAHILAAITLGGGTFYQCAVLVPGLRAMRAQEPREFEEALRGSWAKLVMASALFLVVSGFYNYFLAIQEQRSGAIELPSFYHPLIGTKIVVAFFIFFVASILAGRSPAARRFHQRAPLWLTVNSLAAILVVCLGGVLKMADKTPQPPAAVAPTAPAEVHAAGQ